MLMGMGWIGWIVSLVLGFIVGGVFFITIKLQAEYVIENRGPEWLIPAACYARLIFLAVVLVLVALTVPREKIAGAMLAAVAGSMLARVLIGRKVKKGVKDIQPEETDHA